MIILKVDMFLNHQIDVTLLNEIGKEFHRLFQSAPINKILTIEASGIGIACIAAQYFSVPVVFAKKGAHRNVGENLYTSEVFSFTKNKAYLIGVSKDYLGPDDHVLVIDDFLANGRALIGLKDILDQAGSTLEGIGIVIEKASSRAERHSRDGYPSGISGHRRIHEKRHGRIYITGLLGKGPGFRRFSVT